MAGFRSVRSIQRWLPLGCLLFATVPALAQEGDPATAPRPDFSEATGDARRALVVEATVGNGAAQFSHAFVSRSPPGTHVGDPPLLLVEWFDADGNKLGDHHDWDPRWEFRRDEEGEELVLLQEAVGAFDVPFSYDIASVSVTDLEADLTLLNQVNVREIVHSFCLANQQDPNCEGFDQDGDLVPAADDHCPGTAIPEESVPSSGKLGANRWALVNADGFFTQAEPQAGSVHSFSTADTAGCSCEQIIDKAELGRGHAMQGCSTSAMLDWIEGLQAL